MPSTSIIKTITNVDTAEIVAEMLKRINVKNVIDTTYGVGRFYKKYKPKLLVGVDPNIYDNYVVKPDVLIVKPVWAAAAYRIQVFWGLSKYKLLLHTTGE